MCPHGGGDGARRAPAALLRSPARRIPLVGVYDEEEDELRWEDDDVFPADLFYSFYYYAAQVLATCEGERKQ